jgi:hypothetical protein
MLKRRSVPMAAVIVMGVLTLFVAVLTAHSVVVEGFAASWQGVLTSGALTLATVFLYLHARGR